MFLKQSTAVDILLGPFVDDTDGKTAETGLTIEDEHVDLFKNDTGTYDSFADKNESTTCTHRGNGYYTCPLDGTDTNTCGNLVVACSMSGALPVWHEFQIVEEAIYDALFAASATGELLVDVVKVSGDATAANNMELMFDGTGYAGGTAKLGVDVVAISGDTTAANNMESYYDGTGYGVQASSASTVVTVGALNSAAITDVWSTDTLTESYAADGSEGTAAQLLYMIWSCINDFSISTTTITSKKIGGDSALEWTIDDASSPTSRTRETNP